MAQNFLSNVTVILDLDGTLVDSAPDLTAALNHVLTHEGLPTVAPEVVRPHVGHGAIALMKKGFDLAGLALPEADKLDNLRSIFLDYYENHVADQSTPFLGCIECLEQLSAQGATLAVCTNKMERLTFPLLEQLSLTSHFSEIICRDSLPEYKPSPMPLLEILRRTNASEGVMVGDTETDRKAARAANIPFAYATFGYGLLESPLESNEQCFEEFKALSGRINVLLNK